MQGSSTPFNQWAGLASVLALAAIAGSLTACKPASTSASSASGAAASSEASSSAAASSAPPSGPPTPAGWVRYSQTGFSIDAPANFTPNPSYDYTELGPGKDIKGFSLTIPASLAAGTNLAAGSYISVETLPSASPCAAAPFVDPATAAPSVTSNGITYSVATSSQGAAGSTYDETVYAVQGSSPCLAVRYFIHYANIQNYPAGAVTAFNQAALIAQFNAIRATLVVDQTP
jgi:hypothetical protein